MRAVSIFLLLSIIGFARSSDDDEFVAELEPEDSRLEVETRATKAAPKHVTAYLLEHAFWTDALTAPEFVPRGRIEISSEKRKGRVVREGKIVGEQVSIDIKCGGVYHVRVRKEGSATHEASTAVDGCDLLRSSRKGVAKDSLTFHFEEHLGSPLVSLHYSPLGEKRALEKVAKEGAAKLAFQSKVLAVTPQEAPRPIVPELPTPEEKEKEKEKEQPGFLRKYWLYAVVGVLIVNLFLAPPQEEAKK